MLNVLKKSREADSFGRAVLSDLRVSRRRRTEPSRDQRFMAQAGSDFVTDMIAFATERAGVKGKIKKTELMMDEIVHAEMPLLPSFSSSTCLDSRSIG